jgi:hypothetical protein
VKIKRHANQKTNTGTGKGSNVLNYRLKHSSTGLPMPTPAKNGKSNYYINVTKIHITSPLGTMI